jgi:hypothetical protein
VRVAEFTTHDCPFNPIPAHMTVRRHVLAALAIGAVMLGAGCGGGDNAPLAAETDEPLYQQGLQLNRQGRKQEAFVSFQKVIEKRGERGAPESHLEAGMIYFTTFKNYIEAIHHFQKYLELKPNSPEASRVREVINTAKRELFRTIPARPSDDFAVRPQDNAEIDELRRQNAELRAELATLRGGAAMPVTRSSRVMLPVDAPRASPRGLAAEPSPITLPPAGHANPATNVQPQPPAAPAAIFNARSTSPATPSRPPATAPAPSGRRYRVLPGDSLFAIARKYDAVNTSKKVREITEANPDVFPNGNINTPLKQGTELRIP